MILKRWGVRLIGDDEHVAVDGKGDEKWSWRNYWTHTGAEIAVERMYDRWDRMFPSSPRVRITVIDRRTQ